VRTQRSRQFLCTIFNVPLHLHGVIRSREPEVLFNPELEWQIRHIGFPSFNELEEEDVLEQAELDYGFKAVSKSNEKIEAFEPVAFVRAICYLVSLIV